MQQGDAQESDPNLEMSLREQLLAAGGSGSGPAPYPSSNAPPPVGEAQYPHAGSPSAHEQYNHNATSPAQYDMSTDNLEDDGLSPDARKGKRELSQSKRAAQNRAAQRAFRQRKEGYIKKLEEQVKDHQVMESNFRALQNENYQLREYILSLQSRLLEVQSDFPPAPSHVNLPTSAQIAATREAANPASGVDQRSHTEMQHEAPPATMRQDAMSQLQAAAAQASEARAHDRPYGLGRDYAQQQQAEEAVAAGADSKP